MILHRTTTAFPHVMPPGFRFFFHLLFALLQNSLFVFITAEIGLPHSERTAAIDVAALLHLCVLSALGWYYCTDVASHIRAVRFDCVIQSET